MPETTLTPERVYLETGSVPFQRHEAEFILGAVNERSAAAWAAGVTYDLKDFVREALLEAAQR